MNPQGIRGQGTTSSSYQYVTFEGCRRHWEALRRLHIHVLRLHAAVSAKGCANQDPYRGSQFTKARGPGAAPRPEVCQHVGVGFCIFETWQGCLDVGTPGIS